MLPSETLDLVALLGFVAVLVAAAVSDARHLMVPNRYCLSIALLYGIHVLVSPTPVNWTGALTVAGACLGVGFVLFALRAFGGGDIKLFAAASLWAGPSHFSELVFGTAVAGALLAIVFLLQRRAVSVPAASQAAAGGTAPADTAAGPAASRWKRMLPYGIAIAAGGAQTAVMLFLGR